MFFDGINTTQIFKNYYNALNDSSLDLKNCNSALSILEDDSKYNKFTSILFEGMSEDQLSIANSVCNAQRSFLIEEMSNNISNGDLAIGYAVSYFPILCDTYCTDILVAMFDQYHYNDIMGQFFNLVRFAWIISIARTLIYCNICT